MTSSEEDPLKTALVQAEEVVAILREYGLDWAGLPGQVRYEVRVGLANLFLNSRRAITEAESA